MALANPSPLSYTRLNKNIKIRRNHFIKTETSPSSPGRVKKQFSGTLN